MTRRPLGSSIATWLLTGVLLAAATPAESIDLRFSGAQVNGTGDVTGLNGAYGVTVSPDGKQVYVAGELDNALAVFSRDPATGALTFVEVEHDTVGGVAGLKGAHAVVLSPDGAHVYVASSVADAVVVFSRDAASGALSFVETKRDNKGKVNGLNGAESVAVSPDGLHVYVAGRNDNAIAVFERDVASGMLTFVEEQRSGTGGVEGLLGAKSVAVSPDGAHVYAAGSLDDAVAVFGRDATTGKLTFVEAQREGANGITGLAGARAVTLSPDGANLYVAGATDDALAVFSREAATGRLTFVEAQHDGAGGVNGLNGANAVAISPDGTYVYVTGSVDGALAVFQRDAATGALTFVEQKRNGVGGVAGLHGAAAVAVSPDGYSIYATGSTSDAVADFEVRRCSDGVLDPDEQCDDGNREDGDCCSSSCQLEPATTVCRPAAGPCDVAELCTGSSPTCPADTFEPATFECRPAAGPCDEAELCTGTSSGCPVDTFKPATFECRPAAGDCDVAEACTGLSAACPSDRKRSGVCRPSAGSCDAAETCDGTSDSCPQDRSAPDGTPCDDGNTCTQNETCQQGGCVGGDQVGCNDGDACTVDTCDPLLGCVNQHLEGPAGVTCLCTGGLEPPTCQGQTLPPGVRGRFARACGLIQRAGAKTTRARMAKAARTLKAAANVASQAGRRGSISAQCAAALSSTLVDADVRAQRLAEIR